MKGIVSQERFSQFPIPNTDLDIAGMYCGLEKFLRTFSGGKMTLHKVVYET